jgi:HK97 family phage major capsid protein
MRRDASLLTRRAEVRAGLERLHDLGETQPGGRLTDEQEREWRALVAERDSLDARIGAAQAGANLERTSADALPVVSDVTLRSDRDPRRGFTNAGAFLTAVVEAATKPDGPDERLRPLAVSDKGGIAYRVPSLFNPGRSLRAAVGSDEHSLAELGYGGALAPSAQLPQFLTVAPEADPTVGRVQPVPMTANQVKIPARTDKDHSTSVSGGITMTRVDELEDPGSTRMATEKIVLTAHTLAGYAFVSWELLQDSRPAFEATIGAAFRDAYGFTKLKEKVRGIGGDEYQGVITADCTVVETRTSASTIKGRDIANMAARCWGYESAIWIANQDVRPKMAELHIPVPSEATPTNIISVYQPSLIPGQPDMLHGLPIYYREVASTLGTSGDIILGNWSQYLEGMLMSLEQRESMHVRFLNRESTIMFWERSCGAPWWRTALTPNQSATTLSPFVVLS